MSLAEEIDRSLAEDKVEALYYGDSYPTDVAVATCKKLANLLTELLDANPRFTTVAFPDGRGISVVVRSHDADRRIDFKIEGRRGRLGWALCIDEKLAAKGVEVTLDNPHKIAQLVAWVGGADMP